jgi:hypothetical protein
MRSQCCQCVSVCGLPVTNVNKPSGQMCAWMERYTGGCGTRGGRRNAGRHGRTDGRRVGQTENRWIDR